MKPFAEKAFISSAHAYAHRNFNDYPLFGLSFIPRFF
jgi:hypothetical protein